LFALSWKLQIVCLFSVCNEVRGHVSSMNCKDQAIDTERQQQDLVI